MKAVLEHLTGEKVDLKVYSDNRSCVAAAQREGVGRIKHLDGTTPMVSKTARKRFGFETAGHLQQIQLIWGPNHFQDDGYVFFFSCLDFQMDGMILDFKNFRRKSPREMQERESATSRRWCHPEVGAAGEGKRAAHLVTQMGKKLLRLTLVALLTEEGRALGQGGQCYAVGADPAPTPPERAGHNLHAQLCGFHDGFRHEHFAQSDCGTCSSGSTSSRRPPWQPSERL